jgi:aquaporin Z
MRATVRPLLAEFVGTFFFVFTACASVVMGSGWLGIALAQAAAFGIAVTATMAISGGHLNPAVTFAIWMAGRLEGRQALGHILVQLLAAVVAAVAVKLLYPTGMTTATSLGVPRLSADMTLTNAVFLEGVLTAFLVSVVFGTAVSAHAPRVGGLAIGLTLLGALLVAGPATGGALNPARAFGPALIAGDWHGHLAHWIGPLLGAAVAALIWGKILLPLPGDPEP